jgi:hypothetical protein
MNLILALLRGAGKYCIDNPLIFTLRRPKMVAEQARLLFTAKDKKERLVMWAYFLLFGPGACAWCKGKRLFRRPKGNPFSHGMCSSCVRDMGL